MSTFTPSRARFTAACVIALALGVVAPASADLHGTFWKSGVSFFWERQGSSLAILDHYAPSFAKVQLTRKPVTPTHDYRDNKELTEIKSLADWMQASPLDRRRFMIANGLHYRDLERIDDSICASPRPSWCPAWCVDNLGMKVHRVMNPLLGSEMSDDPDYLGSLDLQLGSEELDGTNPSARKLRADRHWETTHRLVELESNDVWSQLGWLDLNMKATWKRPGLLDTHIHVTFKRPQLAPAELATWANQLALYAYHLNLYATLQAYARGEILDPAQRTTWDGKYLPRLATILAQPAIPHGVYERATRSFTFRLGATTTTSDKAGPVVDAMFKAGTPLEWPDDRGHRHGPFSVARVGVRQQYTDPEVIGFELTDNLDFRSSEKLFDVILGFLKRFDAGNGATVSASIGGTTPLTVDQLAKVQWPESGKCPVPVRDAIFEYVWTADRLGIELPDPLTQTEELHEAPNEMRWRVESLELPWCTPFLAWDQHPALKAAAVASKNDQDFVTRLTAAQASYAQAIDVAFKAFHDKVFAATVVDADYQELRDAVDGALTRWARTTTLWTYL